MRLTWTAAIIAVVLATASCADDTPDNDREPSTLGNTTSAGGARTQITWVARSGGEESLGEAELTAAADLLTGRLVSAGFENPDATVTGNQLSIVVNGDVPSDIAKVISTPSVSFRHVVSVDETAGCQPSVVTEVDMQEPITACDQDGTAFDLDVAGLSGTHIAATTAADDGQVPGWVVSLELDTEGASLWEDLTAEAASRGGQVAIVVGATVVSAVQVTGPLAGQNMQITGDFTEDEATFLADKLGADRLLGGLDLQEVAVA